MARLEIPSSRSEDIVPPKVFIPIGDGVVVHMHPVEDAGLFIPDGAENPEQTNICTVIAVGPLCKQVKEGDRVFIKQVMANRLYHKKMGPYLVLDEEKHIAGILIETEKVNGVQNHS